MASSFADATGPAAGRVVPARVALVRTRNGRRAMVMSFLAYGALYAAVRAGRTADIDRIAARRLQQLGQPIGPALRAISWPGFPPQSRIIPPVIVTSLWVAGLRLEALFQLGAWSGAVLSEVLKPLARRPRPMSSDAVEIIAAPLRGSSFPSGHVLTYVGVYGFAAHLAGAHLTAGRGRQIVVGALVTLVGLVGPSRVQSGHHWPTDVLGSYLVGLPLLALHLEGYRAIKARLLAASERPHRLPRAGLATR